MDTNLGKRATPRQWPQWRHEHLQTLLAAYRRDSLRDLSYLKSLLVDLAIDSHGRQTILQKAVEKILLCEPFRSA